jgi:hypothetical protein
VLTVAGEADVDLDPLDEVGGRQRDCSASILRSGSPDAAMGDRLRLSGWLDGLKERKWLGRASEADGDAQDEQNRLTHVEAPWS